MEINNRFEYEIHYTKAAEKYLKKHEDIRNAYEDAIKELLIGEHPEAVDIKKIKGKRHDYFRIRIGDHRIIYTVINGMIVVIQTLLAGSRGDIYKKMEVLK